MGGGYFYDKYRLIFCVDVLLLLIHYINGAYGINNNVVVFLGNGYDFYLLLNKNINMDNIW